MADNASDSGLAENAYEVQVVLSDMVDTDNPLAAANDFKALNLYV